MGRRLAVFIIYECLAQIIKDPKLNPYPGITASDGEDMAVEELRLAVSFDTRGANTFPPHHYPNNPPRRARDRAPADYKRLQSESAPTPEPPRSVAATPSPKTASPQIGFVPSSLPDAPSNPVPELSAPPQAPDAGPIPSPNR